MTECKIQLSHRFHYPVWNLTREDKLIAPLTGETFPILRNIPRFVSSSNYAAVFWLAMEYLS